MTSVPITDALTFALMLQRQEGSFTYTEHGNEDQPWRICQRCVQGCGLTVDSAWRWWEDYCSVLAWTDHVLERCPVCERKRPWLKPL